MSGLKHKDYPYQMPLDPVLQEILRHIKEHKVLNAMQICRLINGQPFGYCTRTAMGKDQTSKHEQIKLVEHCKKECSPIYHKTLSYLQKLIRMGLVMQLKTRFWDGNISGKRTDVFTFYFQDLDHIVEFMDQDVLKVYSGDRV